MSSPSIIEQPNGYYAVYSNILDMFCAINLVDPEEAYVYIRRMERSNRNLLHGGSEAQGDGEECSINPATLVEGYSIKSWLRSLECHRSNTNDLETELIDQICTSSIEGMESCSFIELPILPVAHGIDVQYRGRRQWRTAYVVATRTSGTMGFTWYSTQTVADKKFRQEVEEYNKYGDVLIYRFDVLFDPSMSLSEVTAYIDEDIDDLAENAPIVYGDSSL